VNAHLISERRACAESITGPGRRPGGREVQRRVEAALLGGGLGALGLLVSGIVMWFPEAFGQVLRELSYVVHDVTFILFFAMIFDATGERLRSVPFTPEKVWWP